MSGERWRLSSSAWRAVLIGGVAIGVAYALSPLTVWFVAAMVLLVSWVRRGLDGDERRWITSLVILAIVARAAAVAALFLATNHHDVPFGHFFGDEEYFIRRSIWLRNVALDVPIHGADLIYAFDEYSRTIYLYLLALVQILVGPAPYGVHLLGIGCYVAAAVLLHRFVRASLGPLPAAIGLAILLFLPSQFAWSVSALKDPLFFLLMAATIVVSVRLVRGPSWRTRLFALAGVVLLAIVLGTLRTAGTVLTAASIACGLGATTLLLHPRWLLALVVATPIVAGAALSRPEMRLQAYRGVQAAARQHAGHIATPGYTYKLLDERLYDERATVLDMHFDESARFVVRAFVGYLTVPLPWQAQSTSMLAYLPEQMIWYIIVALAPLGLVPSFRRDPLVAGLLFGYVAVAVVTVAVTSGNVGTLVRHRGLALPYLVWFSAVGACELARWLPAASPLRPSMPEPHLFS